MKNLYISQFRTVVKIVCLSLLVPISINYPSFAGELGLDDRLNAKLARHKAKNTIMDNAKREEGDEVGDEEADEDDGCGALDIGTIEEAKPGFATHKPRDIIITSDVININNKCKK